MKSILISIKPKWCYKIASGEKAVELRKSAPKIQPPFKCYIYCTSCRSHFSVASGVCFGNDELYRNAQREIKYGSSVELMCCDNYDETYFLNRKVIGEFICDEIREYYPISNIDPINKPYGDDILASSCVSAEELNDFAWSGSGYGKLYGWHISDLEIFDNPKELSHFVRICPEWEKEPLTDKCYACEHCYRNNEAYATECDCEGEIHIKQAPQSWCYVEENENDRS